VASKLKTRDELAKIVAKLKKQGKKVGFTCGSFDILHAGHADYFDKAKEICDVLVVGVNSDKSVKKYKGEDRPIIPEHFRAKLIAALESVDYVFLFDERRQVTNIKVLKPDFYIKGGDYTPETMTSRPVVEGVGGKAVVLSLTKGISTTDIIEKVLKVYGKKRVSKKIKKNKVSQAVLLDRDGVINKEVEYLHEPGKFEFETNALDGIKRMQDMGFKIVIITTQAGIGLGYFKKEDFYKVNKVMLKGMSKKGIVVDKIYFCPHGVSDKCDCRKPKIGLILRAKRDLNLDLKNSYLIGDKTADIKAGENAGCKTILVKTGHGGKDKQLEVKPDCFAKDLVNAADFILKDQRSL
jgi:rfaE bifunctional protein nucleotidyltransferase chain/domain